MRKNKLLIEKKKRYEIAKEVKSVDEMSKAIGSEEGLDVMFEFIDVYRKLEEKGLVFVTALNKYDGMPFSMIMDKKTGSIYDLEMLLVLCIKSLSLMEK